MEKFRWFYQDELDMPHWMYYQMFWYPASNHSCNHSWIWCT